MCWLGRWRSHLNAGVESCRVFGRRSVFRLSRSCMRLLKTSRKAKKEKQQLKPVLQVFLHVNIFLSYKLAALIAGTYRREVWVWVVFVSVRGWHRCVEPWKQDARCPSELT